MSSQDQLCALFQTLFLICISQELQGVVIQITSRGLLKPKFLYPVFCSRFSYSLTNLWVYTERLYCQGQSKNNGGGIWKEVGRIHLVLKD